MVAPVVHREDFALLASRSDPPVPPVRPYHVEMSDDDFRASIPAVLAASDRHEGPVLARAGNRLMLDMHAVLERIATRLVRAINLHARAASRAANGVDGAYELIRVVPLRVLGAADDPDLRVIDAEVHVHRSGSAQGRVLLLQLGIRQRSSRTVTTRRASPEMRVMHVSFLRRLWEDAMLLLPGDDRYAHTTSPWGAIA